MIWKIFAEDLNDLFINADSFDEALKHARKINPRYSGGVVVDDREKKEC